MNAKELGLLPLLLAVVLMAGCSGKDKSGDKAGDKTGDKAGDKTAGSEPVGRPDFTMTATQLSEEYKKSNKSANEKYRSKVIELTGQVKGFGRNIAKLPYLTLEGATGDLFGVMCFTENKLPWAEATPGQTVRLKGKFDGLVMASLTDSSILEVKGDPAPQLTAAKLAGDYTANPQETEKKYSDKYLILTGEVASKSADNAGAVSLMLKGDGKTKVKCSFDGLSKDEPAPLKVGQTVTVIGQFSSLFASDKDEVALGTCYLTAGPK